MRYCPKCDQEYRDTVSVCADDGTPLVPRTSGADKAKGTTDDVTRLTTIITLDDRFEADELAQDLADQGYDVSIVTNKGPTVGPLVIPGPMVYSVLVPDSEAQAVSALVTEWRAALEQDRVGAERAAEAEEAATEASKA